MTGARSLRWPRLGLARRAVDPRRQAPSPGRQGPELPPGVFDPGPPGPVSRRRARRLAVQALAGVGAARGWTVARRFRTRLVGWMGRRAVEPGDGLCLVPCRAIHTFGMRFPIDVLFIDRQLRIVARVDALPPCRWAARADAFAVVELPAGQAARRGLGIGRLLTEAVTNDAPAGKQSTMEDLDER